MTGNSYDMELLPPRANPDTPTPPPRRKRRSGQRARQALMEHPRAAHLSSPTRVEAGVSQPGVVAKDITASPPEAAVVPPRGGMATPSPFPFGFRTPAAVYASSISTNMSVYEDLPGNHLISICNLITSNPDDSYPESADEVNFFVQNCMASEWDYFGVRNLDAFLAFQAAVDYCFACSDNSSEGDYNPTRECFMVELAEQGDGAPNDDANRPVNPPVAAAASKSAASTNSAGTTGATPRA